jgi:ABC-type glycerol-3-phosphate transport system substrate-binding protein
MTAKLTRRMFVRTASALGLGMAGAAALAACAPKATPEPAAVVKEKEPTAQPAAKEPVVITMNMRAGDEVNVKCMYDDRPTEFMEEHPDIKIEMAPVPAGEYEAKTQTLAAAGNLADVIFASDFSTYHTRLVKQGLIAPVDDYLDAYGKSKDEWIDGAVRTLTHEGKMYGFPKCAHPSVSLIWYNQDMFQDVGIGIPEPYGNSWEDLLEWSEKLAKGPENDRQVWGYFFGTSGLEVLYSPMRSFGGWEGNEEGTECLLDSPECLEWVQYTENLFRKGLTLHEGALPPEGFNGLFAAGRVGMVAGGRWMHNRIVAAVKEAGDPFKWEVIQVPRGPKANGWISAVDAHSATTQSKHPEEAWQVSYSMADLRFSELSLGCGYMCARADDIETIERMGIMSTFFQVQYDSMLQEDPIHHPANCRGSELQTVIVNELDPVWLGDEKATPETMERVKSALQEIYDKPF